MPELHLRRTDETLSIALGDLTATVPWAAVEPTEDRARYLYEDAAAYGRALFDAATADPALRAALTALPAGERLLLVASDPAVEAVPWEYLRTPDGKLLAAHLRLVRGLPPSERRDAPAPTGPLEIVAVPVSPADDRRVLNTEREWRRLVEAVTQAGKALTLTRVRAPTLSALGRAIHNEGTLVVHFMGHGNSVEGRGLLAFEDARARTHLVDAADLHSVLAPNVFLVLLNSCRTAVASEWTGFGNVARGLVARGVPYALGMQFVIPDDAALELSQALADHLLGGWDVEEAVRRMRRTLAGCGLLNADWLAGIPVLYTGTREPAPALALSRGRPAVQPDPKRLEETTDLTALPQAEHFVGRGDEISEVLDALLAPRPPDFVVLHGLGGVGKTALARAVAGRAGWHYGDQVLAVSFATFAQFTKKKRLKVDERFADGFTARLARFYGLDPAQYDSTVRLQEAILQRRTRVRSLLVLDNVETLIDALRRKHPAAKALAAFVRRLKEGDGGLLLTSRAEPPSDWGSLKIIRLGGLDDAAGADLFWALLPADRQPVAALKASREGLSQRVAGHPLAIRLLAGAFAERADDLAAFLADIEDELTQAAQTTPASLEDPKRQATAYACLAYSVRRLTPEQVKVLGVAGMFKSPFPPEFAAVVLDDEEHTPEHLQSLARLGLLEWNVRTVEDGTLLRYELHPLVRWYVGRHLPPVDGPLWERYGRIYYELAYRAYQPQGGYATSALMRTLVRESLPDFEEALGHLPPEGRSSLAYHLAEPYRQLGQPRRAMELLEESLGIYQKLGQTRGIAVTQSALAILLQQMGRPQEALDLFQQSLRTSEDLGDTGGVAATQHALAGLLAQMGRPQEALDLFQQSLHTKQDLGDTGGVAVTQGMMAQLLFSQGQDEQAIRYLWTAQQTMTSLGMRPDAEAMAQTLTYFKAQLGPERFDEVWQTVTDEPQPDWLRDVQAEPIDDSTLIPPEQLQAIVNGTVAMMTVVKEKRDEWRMILENVRQGAQNENLPQDAEFFTALLAILDGQSPSLSDGHPYAPALAEVQAGITAGGPAPFSVPPEVMQAVDDFVNAEDWEATRRVVEAQQAVLFQPVVEAVFQQNIAGAEAAGDQWRAKVFKFFLNLLRACRTDGIETALARLQAASQAPAAPPPVAPPPDLPFDAELIPSTVVALLGSPQDRMAHARYVSKLAAGTEDEGLRAFLDTIQNALFARDLSDLAKLGGDLSGVYAQAWESICGVVKRTSYVLGALGTIVDNTLAVLGPAAGQRSEWRNALVDFRNGATVRGDQDMVRLLDAVIGLLDAGGDPTGLGVGPENVYAEVWGKILAQLRH